MPQLFFLFFIVWNIVLIPKYARVVTQYPPLALIILVIFLVSLVYIITHFKAPDFGQFQPSKPQSQPQPEPEPVVADGLPNTQSIFKKNVKNDTRKSDTRGPKLIDTLNRLFGGGFELVKAVEGPTVTQFIVKTPEGIQIKKILNQEEQIKFEMGTAHCSIRPNFDHGIPTISIEIASLYPVPVLASDIISYRPKSILDVPLGKNVAGKTYGIDLADTPHLLIAGTTGSGKSVVINMILGAILSYQKPEDVQLYMIDPKQLELKPYSGIPHLGSPIVADPDTAALIEKTVGILTFLVDEMERRYSKLDHAGVRNIHDYRKKGRTDMPYIVLVFDEVGDVMVTAKDEVEPLIIKLAQKSRASGIHMILATQRPSVDVITGLIKANIPSQIALKTSKAIDSRIILDEDGAEKLLGKGDMLVHMTGQGLVRVQGAYISIEETERLVRYWREH